MKLRMRAVIVVCLILIPSTGCLADEYIDYFIDAKIDVDKVVGKRSAILGDGYEIRAAYGYPDGSRLKGHFVGVFLVRDGSLIEVIDVIPSERRLDFFPLVRESEKSHAVISFVSDYGELAKRKYLLDLARDKKLVRIISLPAEGIPDDLR